MKRDNMKLCKWIACLSLLVVACTVQAAPSDNVITRLNQQKLDCTITVDVRTNPAQDYYSFTISIPKDDPRLKRLFRMAFVLGTGKAPYPQRLDVPLEVKADSAGNKAIVVGVGKDQLVDSFVKFECFWPQAERSSLDVVFLDLNSYI
jgi:hypothetical protein